MHTPIHMENYKKHLSNIIDLTEEQWAEIEKFLVVKHIKKNEFILEPGEYSEDYFLLNLALFVLIQ